VKRPVVATLLVALSLGGCASADGESEIEKPAAAEKKEDPPRPPELARPKAIASPLKLGKVRGCLYKDTVDIASIAGQYYGPQDLVAGEVELARELDFTVPSEVRMVNEAEFGQELQGNAGRYTSREQKVNRWVEWNLGYRPFSRKAEPSGKGTDLIAGFYDPRTQEVVIQQDGELDAEYIVLAHEFAHAAVDQRFGLSRKYSPLTIDDKELAYDALVEGDATLTEYRLSSRIGRRDAVIKGLKALLTSEATFKRDRAKGVPYAAIDRFVFPYRWGVAFACSVFREGGWSGVNKAHAKHPTSTAEIMFPERFLKGDDPNTTAALTAPGKRWKLFAKGTIGAAHLKALFEAPADKEGRALSNPLGRAAAWDGGVYRLWAPSIGSINSIFGMSFVEHRGHKGVLCSSMIKWYEKTFSTAEREVLADDVVAFEDALRGGVIDCRGNDVKVGIGRELRHAEKVVGL
jgi:hypothetical protein